MQKATTIILCTFILLVGIASFIGYDIYTSEVSDSDGVPAIFQNGVIISGVDVGGLTIWEAEDKIKEVEHGNRS